VNADGYITCGLGHEHWGRAGAAGLLVVHTDDVGTSRFLLQHRAPAVHHGDTWSTPGGALHYHESAWDGAFREVREELTYLPSDLSPGPAVVDDHGGWRYTTIVVHASSPFTTAGTGWETGDAGYAWFTDEQITALPLHHGFAATWPQVRAAVWAGSRS
jgi:8-oxo-dGTP pyrophosphatase MutT (NUDIX family)